MRNRSWFCIGTMAAAVCTASTFAGGSNCCVPNGGLGCDDAACSAAVCAADGFCCSVEWDSLCASQAASLCPDLCGSGGGGGDCCTASGGLGCNDAGCQAAVCAQDSFCCSVAWDGLCASQAASLCPDLCGGGGGGDCCTASGGLGCGDAACEAAVCAQDGFCCSVAWDSLCASQAASLCPDLCGGGGSGCGTGGDCCTASGGLGCDDVACCTTVCAVDTFCCSVAWDSLCASQAASLCADLCGSGGSSCVGDLDFNGVVDAADLAILLGGWNGAGATDLDGNGVTDAADLAILLGAWGECPTLCGTGGDCCTASGGLGCNDVACCEAVCAADAFCCSVAWDSLCASQAGSLCSDLCGGGGGGDCCTASGGLGCNDAACEAAVCGADAFCCSVAWDSLCASQAASLCPDLCGGGGGASNCCVANGGVGCDDAGCEAAVCGQDSFCCSVQWDLLCASQAASLCPDLCGGGGGPSNCCVANGGLGCDNATCEAAVCGQDGFCCSVQWDLLCASQAASLCPDICP